MLHALRGLPTDVPLADVEPERGLTERARDAVIAAGWLAKGDHMGTQHLLQGLLAASGPAAGILRGCGVMEWSPVDRTTPRAELATDITPAMKRVLERAHEAMTLRGDQWIDAEHLLLGIVEEPGTEATTTLVRLGVDLASVRRATLAELRAG